MTLQLTVSPDFSPEHIAGWFVFNTWLQRTLGVRCHLELYDDFASQRAAIQADNIDLIFANPFDAAMLVREKGFAPLAAPMGSTDEVLVAVAEASPVRRVEDLKPLVRVAQTQDPDVNLMGMIMLEPADIGPSHVQPVPTRSYVLVAKSLVQERAEVGFFLKQAFDDLSVPTRAKLRPLVTSQISVVRHVLLCGPRMQEHVPVLREALLDMHHPGNDGQRVLEALSLAGWEGQNVEDTEFMIDLMDALMR